MKRVKVRSLKYPEPHINWDFQAEDNEYQAKLDSILGREGLAHERTVEANSEPYTAEDVLEEIPAVMDGDEQLSPPMVRLRAEYTVEVEDITAEVQAQALAAAVQAAINKGNAIIAKVSARNAMKQINTAQTLAFVQAFGGIAQLLQLGALETAKAQVMAIQPSELVTQEDLDFVLGLLTEAIGG
jgi:hypothetical protein